MMENGEHEWFCREVGIYDDWEGVKVDTRSSTLTMVSNRNDNT